LLIGVLRFRETICYRFERVAGIRIVCCKFAAVFTAFNSVQVFACFRCFGGIAIYRLRRLAYEIF